MNIGTDEKSFENIYRYAISKAQTVKYIPQILRYTCTSICIVPYVLQFLVIQFIEISGNTLITIFVAKLTSSKPRGQHLLISFRYCISFHSSSIPLKSDQMVFLISKHLPVFFFLQNLGCNSEVENNTSLSKTRVLINSNKAS